MMRLGLFVFVIAFSNHNGLLAGELVIEPATITLRPPNGEQQLIVSELNGNQTIADLTTQAKYQSSNPNVVTVSETGAVTLVGDGEATITATYKNQTATSKIKVISSKQSPGWSFNQHVEPALTRTGCNSGACHGALAGKGGFKLSLRGYDPETDWSVITRQMMARRADPIAPAESLLLKKAIRALPHGGGTRFGDDSSFYKILHDWIAAGAPGPNANESAIVGIDVYPKHRLAKAAEQFPLIAVARFADGHTEEITRFAKFMSSEEQVATVDEEGKVKIAGSGVAGVSVVFGTHVATSSITVPFVTKTAFAATAIDLKLTTIDRLILEKLNALQLSPSPQASDEEFIRRASLDICGIVPTPDEQQKFLMNRDPNKRVQLIDSLLARPEYVDYWTYKLSDILLVSTRDLPQPATWSYYRAVRQAVADNQPWDQFTKDLLTATGQTSRHGLANYFVLHKDVAKLTETTSLTFLGTSIGCAKCHNHPLEKWTQDQYWQFANLFSRIQLKNGDAAGDVIVTSSKTGDAMHPRLGVPMPPAPLDGPKLNIDSADDRRLHFANWLTSKENPFFAKAIVNRVWKAYMGRGLVEAEDDLRATNPPTNPQLLDALVNDFTKHNFDLKRLMRSILITQAYSRSSNPTPANSADDRFYSRYFIRRLPAEVLLDAYSQITGVATPFDTVAVGVSGGFAKRSDYPLGTRAVQLPDTLLVSRFLDQFGRPERQQSCACERGNDSSVSQALHVSNGQTLNDKLRHQKSIIQTWLADKVSDDDVIKHSFRLTLGRSPTASEMTKYTAVLKEAKDRKEAMEDILWALLTGREFLFNR